jgi:hypothetical protein
MGNKNIEPRDAGGLAIFDNATQRSNVLHSDTYKLAWGKDATRLYAHTDPVFQSRGLSVLAADSTGISVIAGASSLTNI